MTSGNVCELTRLVFGFLKYWTFLSTLNKFLVAFQNSDFGLASSIILECIQTAADTFEEMNCDFATVFAKYLLC
jgi:hypothetical protein